MQVAAQRLFPNASPLARDLLAASALALACVVSRLLTVDTLALPGVERMVLLWPPTVFLFVALLASPYRRWWMLVAASVLASILLMRDTPPAAALLMEAANSGQALAVAWTLRAGRFTPPDILTVAGAIRFLLVAVCLAPLTFSVISAGLLDVAGFVDDFRSNWEARGITNILSALTLGPPLLLAVARLHRLALPQLIEGTGLLAAIPLVEILVATLTVDLIGVATALLYLPILFFIWAAVRLGPAVVSLAALMITLTRVYLGTPIVTDLLGVLPSDGLLMLQMFVVAMAVPFLLLSVIIDERRRADAEVRASVERHRIATTAGRVGAWNWNLDTDEVVLDPSLKAMLGYEDHEIANDMQDWGRHVHPADRDRVAARVDAHLGRGEPFEIEHRMLHKDGSIRWFLARGAVVERGDDGRPLRMMGTDVDVTERRHIEDALQALRAGIHKSGRTQGMSALAASVAHEVKQPLFAIVANAQACLRWLDADGPDIEQVREALRDIAGEGERASDLINRTRAMFRHRALERRPVAIGEIVSLSVDIMRRQLQEAEVTVVALCPPDVPAVLGDQVQLQQVLDNLIANALEALRKSDHPRSLTIEAREEAEHVRVTVSDSGCGVAEQDLSRIFEPFFSTSRDGLGLGLAISRSIILAHGGEIRAERAGDGGMRFDLVLPRGAQDEKAAPVPA